MLITTDRTKTDSTLFETEEIPFSDGYYPSEGKTIVIPSVMKYYEEVNPPNSDMSRRTTWNDFEHYKLDASNGSPLPARLECYLLARYGPPTNRSWTGRPSSPYAFYSPLLYGEAGKLNLGLSTLYSKRPDGGFVPPPDNLNDLKQRSLTSMLPIIKSELSLVNSIVELKDFASLPRTIKTAAELPKILPEVYQRFKLGLRTTTKSLRQWLRAGADTYLQAKFNILPLLSDMTGIRRALSRTERRLNDFITRAGRTQKKHYVILLNESPPQSYDTNSTGVTYLSEEGTYIGCELKSERFVYHSPTTFHAEIEYNYNYTQYQLEHARLLSLLDAVGVNFNPAIIWNAIPWSFVVDWVIGVGQWLNRNRIGLMDPQINIHRYLWSVKRSRRILMNRQTVVSEFGYGGPPYSTSPTVPAPTVNETAYRRQVGMPEASSIGLSGLNVNEFSLGSALVIARRRSPKRRLTWAYKYVFPG